jgi:hypothetical protein
MSELLRQWNGALEADGVRFVKSVGHTGNYIVETERACTVARIQALISERLKVRERLNVRVAAFDAADFLTWTSAAQTSLCALPSAPPGRRATPGVVMDLNPAGGVPSHSYSDERVMFAPFAVRRVQGVWKMDVLRADGRGLDHTKREGGWGSVAVLMRRYARGEWTTRSMRTIRLLARRVEALPTVPGVPSVS